VVLQGQIVACQCHWRHRLKVHAPQQHRLAGCNNTSLLICWCVQVLREEGKYAYAAEWRRHRVLIKALLLLMLHAVGGDQQNTEAEGAASEGSETEV